MAVGALSVAEDEPELSRRILDASRQSIVKAMNSFAPDGGWEEGPGYWNYATSYNVFYLDAIKTALGTDFNLSQMPGFPVTGTFRAHSIGPTGLAFNYADASEKAGVAPQMFWLANEFDRPADAIQELHGMGANPRFFHLLWSEGRLPEQEAQADLPLDGLYRGINVAFFRSAWNDPQALFVGFKGGDNRANHSHLDLGTFVLDALGQRWAIDLGGDEYNLPGYFGGKRWTYYRLKTEGHNTVSLAHENQDPKARAAIIAYQSRPNYAYAVADLTEAYGEASVRKALRGVGLLDRKQVLVIDEVESDRALDLSWSLHTRASVTIDGPTATLSRDGNDLEIRLLDPPAGTSFSAAEVKTPEPQRSNAGVSRITLNYPPTTSARIAVLFTPGGRSDPIQVPRLADWIKDGPLPPLAPATHRGLGIAVASQPRGFVSFRPQGPDCLEASAPFLDVAQSNRNRAHYPCPSRSSARTGESFSTPWSSNSPTRCLNCAAIFTFTPSPATKSIRPQHCLPIAWKAGESPAALPPRHADSSSAPIMATGWSPFALISTRCESATRKRFPTARAEKVSCTPAGTMRTPLWPMARPWRYTSSNARSSRRSAGEPSSSLPRKKRQALPKWSAQGNGGR